MNKTATIRAPQQQRSSETLARIVTAARELIDEQHFENVTMAEIAKRARVSVGNLYNRFANKDALLSHILDEMQSRQGKALARGLSPEAGARLPLADKVQMLVAGTDASIRANRGTVRAVVMRHALDSDKLTEEQKQASARMVDTVALWLGTGADNIPHPDPALACRMAAMITAIAFQYSALIDTPARMFGEDVFVTELERMIAAYLGANQREKDDP